MGFQAVGAEEQRGQKRFMAARPGRRTAFWSEDPLHVPCVLRFGLVVHLTGLPKRISKRRSGSDIAVVGRRCRRRDRRLATSLTGKRKGDGLWRDTH